MVSEGNALAERRPTVQAFRIEERPASDALFLSGGIQRDSLWNFATLEKSGPLILYGHFLNDKPVGMTMVCPPLTGSNDVLIAGLWQNPKFRGQGLMRGFAGLLADEIAAIRPGPIHLFADAATPEGMRSLQSIGFALLERDRLGSISITDTADGDDLSRNFEIDLNGRTPWVDIALWLTEVASDPARWDTQDFDIHETRYSMRQAAEALLGVPGAAESIEPFLSGQVTAGLRSRTEARGIVNFARVGLGMGPLPRLHAAQPDELVSPLSP